MRTASVSDSEPAMEDIELLKATRSVAVADGQLLRSEMGVVEGLAKRIGLGPVSYGAMLKAARKDPSFADNIRFQSRQKARAAVRLLVGLARIDGIISDEERKVIVQIAVSLGITGEVDEVSVIQSEYTAMAFRAASNAVVVGSTSAGTDGNVSRIPLPGGLSTRISGIGVFYPDKTPTPRVGIIADVEVRPTIESIRQGRDRVLEEAVRQILQKDVADAEIRRIATPSAQHTQ